MTAISNNIDDILIEYRELEQKLANPDIHTEVATARKLSKRFAQISPIVKLHLGLKTLEADYLVATELSESDASFGAEAKQLAEKIESQKQQLADALIPRDPHDGSDVLLEVKSGEGGEESALFAADLARMYLRYAESQRWLASVLDVSNSDLGGYKEITLSIKSKASDFNGVWDKLKYEGGVHRVQRVPVTESQGRVHTSAAGVFVFPDVEADTEIKIDESDLRIDVYRSSGKGGQGVNTTDSAVRITHLPTGIVVTCQNERSQLQNKARALQVLAARLRAVQEEAQEKAAAADRARQIRKVDRSERIRTYNYPENRITDHRIGYKAHNLAAVLDGEMEELLQSLMAADRQARIQGGASV